MQKRLSQMDSRERNPLRRKAGKTSYPQPLRTLRQREARKDLSLPVYIGWLPHHWPGNQHRLAVFQPFRATL